MTSAPPYRWVLRPARAEDAPALTDLCWRAKAYWGYDSQQMALWRDELIVRPERLTPPLSQVAEVDGHLAGYFVLIAGSPAWHLDDLFVDPAFMGAGVGKALFAAAAAIARAAGAAGMTIDADPNAAPFYLAQGAVRVGDLAAPIRGDAHRVRPQLSLRLS